MYLSASAPLIECKVRSEYTCGGLKNRDEDCIIFGVSAILNRALSFHAQLKSGAVFWRLPLSAFYWKPTPSAWSTAESTFWDCISYHIAVTRFQYLKDRDCEILTKASGKVVGQYLFTVDFADSGEEMPMWAETADEHKCAHILKLENGNFAAYPNNRILWRDASFVRHKPDALLDYKAQSQLHFAETTPLNLSDRYMY